MCYDKFEYNLLCKINSASKIQQVYLNILIIAKLLQPLFFHLSDNGTLE